jgi:hypothetical protein
MLISTKHFHLHRNLNNKYFAVIIILIMISCLSLILPGYIKSDINPNICTGYNNLVSYSSTQPIKDQEICNNNIPTIHINLKTKYYLQLLMNRELALSKSYLSEDEKNNMPAMIFYQGKSIKSKLRFKGDLNDHLELNKSWSLRIKLDGESHIFGFRTFSLQHPRVRNYDADPIFNFQMRNANILSPRYQFAQIYINNIDWGLMELEEHVSNKMIEASQRKESIIVKLDEKDYWKMRGLTNTYEPYNNIYTSTLTRMNNNKSEVLDNYSLYSKSLFQAWQSQRLSIEDILDINNAADYIVNAEIWGLHIKHTMQWNNRRFYFNPYNYLLEQISYDFSEDISNTNDIYSVAAHSQLLEELFNNPYFNRTIYKAWYKLEKRFSDNSLLEEMRIYQHNLKNKYTKFNMPTKIDLGILENNINDIGNRHKDYFRKVGEHSYSTNTVYSDKLHSYAKLILYENGQIEIQNKLTNNIIFNRITILSNGDIINTLDFDAPQIIEGTPLNKRATSKFYNVGVPPKDAIAVVTFTNANNNMSVIDYSQSPILYVDKSNISQFLPSALNDSIPEFAITDEALKTITVPEGNWKIKQPIIINNNYELYIKPGANLSFSQDSFIYSHNAIHINGTYDKPILLKGLNNNDWRGIYIYKSANLSTISHASIKNIGAFSHGYFKLSGALNYYYSDVTISDVNISNIRSEDVFNFVHSSFKINALEISNSWSDAIDTDFSTGDIENSTFNNIKGDAIDLNSSKVNIINTYTNNISDKAISVGENSFCNINSLTVTNSNIGVATKDYSKTFISNSTFENIELSALMSYVKKPEYGGAFLKANNNTFLNTNQIGLNDINSILIVDGKYISGKTLNINYLYSKNFISD